jgi:hypothetical protein
MDVFLVRACSRIHQRKRAAIGTVCKALVRWGRRSSKLVLSDMRLSAAAISADRNSRHDGRRWGWVLVRAIGHSGPLPGFPQQIPDNPGYFQARSLGSNYIGPMNFVPNNLQHLGLDEFVDVHVVGFGNDAQRLVGVWVHLEAAVTTFERHQVKSCSRIEGKAIPSLTSLVRLRRYLAGKDPGEDRGG